MQTELPIDEGGMYTPAQAIEAIKARINDDWNNKQLLRLGQMTSWALDDIEIIIEHTLTPVK